MTYLDAFLILWILFSVYRGYRVGVLAYIGKIFLYTFGILLSYVFSYVFLDWIYPKIFSSKLFSQILLFLVIFLLLSRLVPWIQGKTENWLEKFRIHKVNYILGAVFQFLKIVFLVFAIISLIIFSNIQWLLKPIRNSKVSYYLFATGRTLSGISLVDFLEQQSQKTLEEELIDVQEGMNTLKDPIEKNLKRWKSSQEESES